MPLVLKGLKPADPIAPPQPIALDTVNADAISRLIILESHDAFFAYSSLRRLIRQQEKLLPKLDDEALQGDSAIDRARMASIQLDQKMSSLLATVASSESDASRGWIRLTPRQRIEAAQWWRADPAQGHLIGHSFEAWPECEIPADFPVIHLPRILRNLRGWPAFEDWRREGVYRP